MSILTQPWPVKPGWIQWLIAAAIAAGLIAAFSLFDGQLSRLGQALPASVVTVASWITMLGLSDWILYPSLVLGLVSAALAWLIPKPVSKRALWQMTGIWAFIFLGVGLPGLFTTLVKRLIGRGRPEHLDALGTMDFRWNWVDWTHQSFPSGHTTTAFAFCFVVSFLSPRWYPAMLVLAAAIGLSRVVVGAHYPTDVLAGAVVGTLGAYLVRNLFASRGWVFSRLADGTYVVRPQTAVRRLIQTTLRKRPAPSQPRP